MYDYLLFDLDGTLTDSKPGIINCLQYALEKLGKPEPDGEKLNCYVGPPLHKTFEKITGDPEKAMVAVGYYRERFATVGLFENSVYEGIIPMLQKLKAAGKTLAVATSKPQPYTDRILERYELTESFTVIVGSEMDGGRSDKAEVIAEAIKRLNIKEEDKDRILMIGDRQYDMIGAAKNGIASMGVGYGYAEGDELEDAGAVYQIDTVDELEKFLLQR